MAQYNERGQELPDPKPVAMPAGMRVPESLADTMRRLIRVEMSRQAVEMGQESFDEADDFDVEDGEALLATPYELAAVQEERDYREPELIPAASKPPAPPPAPPPLGPAASGPAAGGENPRGRAVTPGKHSLAPCVRLC